MIKLRQHLQTHAQSDINRTELARALGVSPRTLYRDFQDLESIAGMMEHHKDLFAGKLAAQEAATLLAVCRHGIHFEQKSHYSRIWDSVRQRLAAIIESHAHHLQAEVQHHLERILVEQSAPTKDQTAATATLSKNKV